MKKPSWLPIALMSVAAAAGAEDFDGSKLIICKPLQGHDCLPTQSACKPLKPEAGKDVNLYFDVADMKVRTPYRTTDLPIQTVSNNTKSLVLQGTSLEYLWGATIHRTTGRLSIAIVDREGSYVIFGECKLAEATGASK